MELLRSWNYPEEVYALLRYKFGAGGKAISENESSKCVSSQLKKCYEYLDKASRSFTAVIRTLDDELRFEDISERYYYAFFSDAVCIGYLVLRALDTVEDDMTIPHDEKVTLLQKFYTFLEDPSWNYTKCIDKDRIVLDNFSTISAQYRLLKPIFREVISNCCRQMGGGMAVYSTKSIGSLEQYDEYCHYAIGVPGIGLSQLFVALGLENRILAEEPDLTNLGWLILQKANVIRDYLEDVTEGRQWWPKEVWSKYSDRLIELSDPKKIDDAVSCLNELITNALLHIPDVIKFLSHIQKESIFNFCAIPQVMAVATLDRCYNNRQVFRGIVKIRKGEAVRLMMQASNIDNVKAVFGHYLRQIESKIPSSDPSAHATRQAIEIALSKCETDRVYSSATSIDLLIYMSLAVLLIAIILYPVGSFI